MNNIVENVFFALHKIASAATTYRWGGQIYIHIQIFVFIWNLKQELKTVKVNSEKPSGVKFSEDSSVHPKS